MGAHEVLEVPHIICKTERKEHLDIEDQPDNESVEIELVANSYNPDTDGSMEIF